MAVFFNKIFGRSTERDQKSPAAAIKPTKSEKLSRESVAKFGEELLKDFKSRKYSKLNSDQKAALEAMQHQIKQYLKELEKQGRNSEKNLPEIAHEIFVIACASEMPIEAVEQFFMECGFGVLDLNKFNKSGKFNALAAALVGGRNKKFLKWLIALGANVNFKSPDGNNMAHIAAMFGLGKDVMEFLIEEGVDINAQNNEGMTALDISMLRIDRELVGFLRENGAKAGLKDLFAEKSEAEKNAEKEKINAEKDDNKEVSKEEQLHDAILKGDVATVSSLIFEGANVNAMQNGETILQTAVRAGNWSITEKVADRATTTTKENIRGASNAVDEMIDNAGSIQSRVQDSFNHHRTLYNNNSQGNDEGGRGR